MSIRVLACLACFLIAAALLPVCAHANFIGSFASLTNASGFVNGCEQPAHRPVDADGIMLLSVDGNRIIEEWFSFSTRSLIPGHEQVRGIYLHLNSHQSGYFAPLLNDPDANVSYSDPAWSSDGRFLAYVQSDADGANQRLYVQEFVANDDLNESHGGSYPVGQGAEDPVGAPILVIGSGNPRHPDWSPTGHTIAYDSNVLGSVDLYTVDVDVVNGTASVPTRRTFVDNKAETNPSWAPNGHDIAYSTNKFGPRVIEIIDLSLSSANPNYTRLAESCFAFVSHNNPDWTSDGGSIFYDAPSGEDASAVTAVWVLNLTTQTKYEFQLDPSADADPDVSGILNHTSAADGFVPFNYFLFTSSAGGLGLNIWRGMGIPEFGPALLIVGSDEVCAASVGNGYSVSNAPIGVTTFAWSVTGNGSIVGPTDGTSVTVNAGAAGSFTLIVTMGGCSSSRSSQKVVVVTQCVGNCPRTAGFWTQQYAQKGNESTKFTVAEVSQIAECVDDHSALFSWPSGTDFSSFGGTVNPPSPMNQRKQAKRQFATMLANVCTGQLGLVANNGDKISLGLSTPINCAGLTSGTIGGVIGEVDGRLVSLEGQPLTDPAVKSEYSNLIACLDAINNGIGIGTVCPEVAPVPGGGIGLARGVVGRVFAALPAPNPFSQSTYFVLAVTGTESKPVDVRVFDVAGKLVRILATGSLPPGRHEMVWDGYSEQARRMPTGVYFLQSAVGGDKAVIRLLYLR